MKILYVYADFDWLKEIKLMGELGYESLRGSDSYCFTFNDEWLKKHGDLFLSDDHFRNHGFLLTAKGWMLSPAYDMNPTLNEYQSLLVSSTSNKADLNILLEASEDYMLNRKIAEKIISEVVSAVKNWRELATRLGISKREMDMFAGVLDERHTKNTFGIR